MASYKWLPLKFKTINVNLYNRPISDKYIKCVFKRKTLYDYFLLVLTNCIIHSTCNSASCIAIGQCSTN